MITYPTFTKDDLLDLMDEEIASGLSVKGAPKALLAAISLVLSISFVGLLAYALSLSELGNLYYFITDRLSHMTTDGKITGTDALACFALAGVGFVLLVLFMVLAKKLYALFMSPFVPAARKNNPEKITTFENTLHLLTVVDEIKAFVGDGQATFKPGRRLRPHTLKVTVLDENCKKRSKRFYMGSTWRADEFMSEKGLDFSNVRLSVTG